MLYLGKLNVLRDENLPVFILPLDGTSCHVQLVFCEIRPWMKIFQYQIKDKQMPQNAPPKFFKKVDTPPVKMQIKFGLGNKKELTPSIGQN